MGATPCALLCRHVRPRNASSLLCLSFVSLFPPGPRAVIRTLGPLAFEGSKVLLECAADQGSGGI